MKKLLLSLALLPMMAMAGNVKSPNGNIELKFSVNKEGRPVYEMTIARSEERRVRERV